MIPTDPTSLPTIIQGGMGVAISSWRLARAVARRGQLGVVSGTAVERITAGRLQQGDPEGEVRAAIARFPDQAVAQRVVDAWYRADPDPTHQRMVPMFSERPSQDLLDLTVVAAFAEITLAKQGHSGQIGINLLEKIRTPTLPILYGAMLAGVDWVLMGAGIPRDLPGQLATLARHERTELRIPVENGDPLVTTFDPQRFDVDPTPLPLPRALAVVSSDILAASLARQGGFAGFVVENHRAGGHNAPPRGGIASDGSLAYGDRDQPNLARLRALGLPFWLAGGIATAQGLREARAAGAAGIQVGTVFALCEESGMEPNLKRQLLAELRHGTVEVRTEGLGSPTGYPFKVVVLPGTLGAQDPGERARRTCNIGALRQAVRLEDGSVVWRCPAEPEDRWVAKGGRREDTVGRRCLCQGLMATAGQPQLTANGPELPVLTAGDHLDAVLRFLPEGAESYTADAVLDDLLAPES